MVSPIDLSYTAGLFDGEGCISFARRSRQTGGYRYSLSVSVEMSDEESIDFLHAIFGGNKMFYDRYGKKRLYRWSKASLQDVRDFLVLIEPYVKYKRPQVMAAIGYCDYMILGHVFTNAGYPDDVVAVQEEIYADLRAMKAEAGGMR